EIINNPPTTETPNSDEGNDVEPHDDDVNRLDKDVLSRVRETCVKRCLTTMPDTRIIDNRINLQGINKESRDIFIMGQLKLNKISCFLFVNNINTHYLKNIMKHYISEGAVPRVLRNTGRTPKHAVTY
ncbi:hypothetical protein KUTeg_010064, partial [Tegillarca granosa]